MSIEDVLSGAATHHVACERAEAFVDRLPDGCVGLMTLDFPYFQVKGPEVAWDNAWPSAAAFIEWMGTVLAKCRRVLAPNGSIYAFASPDMAARSVAKHRERGPDGKAPPSIATAAWLYVSRVLSVQAAEKKNPGCTDLFYTRGIARKRCGHFNDWQAMEALKTCQAVGATADEMREVAKTCKNWTGWLAAMADLWRKHSTARGAA